MQSGGIVMSHNATAKRRLARARSRNGKEFGAKQGNGVAVYGNGRVKY